MFHRMAKPAKSVSMQTVAGDVPNSVAGLSLGIPVDRDRSFLPIMTDDSGLS
jgi:hypothetical protein